MLTFPSTSTLISLLFINGLFYQLSSSLPIGRQHGAAALLSWRNYDDLQISGGIGGTALEEAARILQGVHSYRQGYFQGPTLCYVKTHFNIPLTKM